MSIDVFADRADAGRALAAVVCKLSLPPPVLVLGLPRGGVPVAYEVARALEAPLDVLVVRKIGVPGQPEFAIGAIASGGIVVQEHVAGSPDMAARFGQLVERERVELQRRDRAYRRGLPPLDLSGRTVVLVDDGLATGATMVAAVRSARMAGAARVVVAAPVASEEAVARLSGEADQVAVVRTPARLYAIGACYRDFAQVGDAQVQRLLELAAAPRAGGASHSGAG